MNTSRKTLLGLLALCLLSAPVAVADPLDDLHIEKDVAAHYQVDYSQVLDGVDDAKDLLEEAKAVAQEKASAKTDAGATATTGVGSGIVAGVKENAAAFLGWIKGLSFKPKPDVAGYVSATNAQDLASDVRSLDGSVEGDVIGHLEATSVMEDEVPAPPEPKLGFLGEMRAAFAAFLDL